MGLLTALAQFERQVPDGLGRLGCRCRRLVRPLHFPVVIPAGHEPATDHSERPGNSGHHEKGPPSQIGEGLAQCDGVQRSPVKPRLTGPGERLTADGHGISALHTGDRRGGIARLFEGTRSMIGEHARDSYLFHGGYTGC